MTTRRRLGRNITKPMRWAVERSPVDAADPPGRGGGTPGEGRPSPARYAEMVREDRRIRLAGYGLYRFGGHEFGPT